MRATWYLFQFTPDMRAHEPRNVGLALHAPDGWHFQFLAVDDRGEINAHQLRWVGLDKDVYASWISYYRRKALGDDWETALTLQHRRPSNFDVVTGGTLLEERPDWDEVAFTMFRQLVRQPRIRSEGIVEEALRIFQEANITPEREIFLPGRWDQSEPEVGIKFRFGVQNDIMHGIDVANTAAHELGYLKSRIDAVSRVGSAPRMIAMLPLGGATDLDETVESLVHTIERNSHTLDIQDPDAPRNLVELLQLS